MFYRQQPIDQQERDRSEFLRLQQSENTRRYYNSPERGAKLPAMQAVFSGVFVGALVGVGAGLIARMAGQPLFWDALQVTFTAGVLAFLLTCALVWFYQLSDWRAMVWNIESALQVDLDRDGQNGPPAPPQTVKVELTSEDRKQKQFADIPASPEKLADFARGVLSGQPISERQWSGAGALFSQNEFRQVRDAFLARAWMRYKDDRYPQQGVELAPAGKAVLRTFASGAASPTPTLRDREE